MRTTKQKWSPGILLCVTALILTLSFQIKAAKSKDDLKDPVLRRQVVRQTQQLLLVLKLKDFRNFEIYMKVENFKQNLIQLVRSFIEDYKTNSVLVIEKFKTLFIKFASMQQNIMAIVKRIDQAK